MALSTSLPSHQDAGLDHVANQVAHFIAAPARRKGRIDTFIHHTSNTETNRALPSTLCHVYLSHSDTKQPDVGRAR